MKNELAEALEEEEFTVQDHWGLGACQEGFKRRDVKQALGGARALGGRVSQALRTRTVEAPAKLLLVEPPLARRACAVDLSCPRSEARAEAGKAPRMRRTAGQAPQDGEGKVEFSSGNLTR